jgi:JmjC domain, hydroxylase
MFSPVHLLNHGCPVYRAVQRQGDIVVTFPGAYHGGFSHGYSRAEAIKFAPASWLPYGREALAICAQTGTDPAVAHDELLWSTIGYILKKKQEADEVETEAETEAETEDTTGVTTADSDEERESSSGVFNHIPREDVTCIE